MKACLSIKGGRLLLILATAVLLNWICFPSPGLSLMALPDIGINYNTMKVNNADKLSAAGMKDVRNGDRISSRISPDEGKIIFTNLRTGEELVYPPATPRTRKNRNF